jgi:hypothetical protein
MTSVLLRLGPVCSSAYATRSCDIQLIPKFTVVTWGNAHARYHTTHGSGLDRLSVHVCRQTRRGHRVQSQVYGRQLGFVTREPHAYKEPPRLLAHECTQRRFRQLCHAYELE